ncbi:hypothetical protein [Microcoleus sp. CAWBG58]|uniref:hypothetical protein n=1 Tax=Microcoleus sp. CAWBG58 TaxID=2841651 RepID=UPI002600C313|nr:hypothetical protein [Microcoleus sp. CAWBG58]
MLLSLRSHSEAEKPDFLHNLGIVTNYYREKTRFLTTDDNCQLTTKRAGTGALPLQLSTVNCQLSTDSN